jgi:hypothetical protein
MIKQKMFWMLLVLFVLGVIGCVPANDTPEVVEMRSEPRILMTKSYDVRNCGSATDTYRTVRVVEELLPHQPAVSAPSADNAHRLLMGLLLKEYWISSAASTASMNFPVEVPPGYIHTYTIVWQGTVRSGVFKTKGGRVSAGEEIGTYQITTDFVGYLQSGPEPTAC